jgi:Flp pilus assembly protein TadD
MALLLAASGCAATSAPSLSALHYFRAGNNAYQAEDYRHAIALYRRALQYDDGAADFHYNLGLAYYRVEAYEDAVQAYQRALAIDPELADAHHNLALAYHKLYNLTAADHHYNTYLRLVTGPRQNDDAATGTPTGTPTGTVTGSPSAITAQAGVPAARAVQGIQAVVPGASHRAPAGQGLPWDPARAQRVPPAIGGAGGQGTASDPNNPFQGTDKWWTQDPANPTR